MTPIVEDTIVKSPITKSPIIKSPIRAGGVSCEGLKQEESHPGEQLQEPPRGRPRYRMDQHKKPTDHEAQKRFNKSAAVTPLSSG
jgi:hypothetical protein